MNLKKSIPIFLADDHAIVREGLRLIIEQQDHLRVVGEASDGLEAIQKMEELHPDLAILDIAMPKLNGIDAAQEILSSHPDMNIIILSMHASSEYVIRALKAGVKGYVLKESAGQEVLEAIQTVLQGHVFLSLKISDLLVEDLLEQDLSNSNPFDRLSIREKEVLQLVVEGKSSSEIADLIHLSPKTVDTYRSRLMQKLGVKNKTSLIKFALDHKFLPSD